MVSIRKERRSKRTSRRSIGKPTGVIRDRVKAVGPERFGVVAVDCGKGKSDWMLCDAYGTVIHEPANVLHASGCLKAMVMEVKEVFKAERIGDAIVAVEMTGVYHKPIQRVFRMAGFDVRTVHPFATCHFRSPLHPDLKTDDNDLEAIVHAAINGYAIKQPPTDPIYEALKLVARHRHNLVKQRSRIKTQIREMLHQVLPGFADLFEEDKLFHKSIAIPVALAFPSPSEIQSVGIDGIALQLRKSHVRFQSRTIERIVAWSGTAAAPSEFAATLTHQWQQLNQLRMLMNEQIDAAEREMAGLLVKTPYILLLTVKGINVVSAARFAGEAGPIQYYPTARAINGRAGLYPTRYQSCQVDYQGGGLARHCNRKLRGAAMKIAANLIKCHPYYRGMSENLRKQGVHPRDRHCRIANRAMRMVFQIVSGRKVWRGHRIREDLALIKLRNFLVEHKTPPEEVIRNFQHAIDYLPESAYAGEGRALADLFAKKQRGPEKLGDLVIELLILRGVITKEELESTESEARSFD